MELKNKKIDNAIIIYLQGRLDVHLSSETEKGINSLIMANPGSDFVLNLRDVEYMSSSGLRIFVSTMRVLKESKKKLKLTNMNAAVKKIFEVVELMDMFDIHENDDDAVRALKRS